MSRLPYPKGMRCLAASIVVHFKLGTAASAIPLAGSVIEVIEHLGPHAVVQWLLEHQCSSIIADEPIGYAGRGRKGLSRLQQHKRIDAGLRVRGVKVDLRADSWVKAVAKSREALGCGRDRLALLLQEIEKREGLPERDIENIRHSLRCADKELKANLAFVPRSPLG